MGETYYRSGHTRLELQDEELIAEVKVAGCPQLSLQGPPIIPPRSLAIVNVRSGVTEEHIGQLFEVILNGKLLDQYLNLQVVAMVHRVDNLSEDIVPFVLINLGNKTISLRRRQVVGSLASLQIDVSEISTDTAHEVPDPDEGYQTADEETLQPKLEEPGASFITSPTDVEEHRKPS